MRAQPLEVAAVTEIDASPARVWAVLTDLGAFAAWNPFIRRARGSTDLGAQVRVRVSSSLPFRLGFRATVVACEAGRALRWRGHVLAPWLASGDHTFSIEPLAGNRVRFAQRETFSGVLPRLARGLLAREAQRGFDAMNRALAERAREEHA